MALSDQLRNIANQARGAAQQQQSAGMAQVGTQTAQALQAGPQTPRGLKAGSQRLAGAVTAAQQQVANQAQQGLTGQLQQLGQQQLAGQRAAQQRALGQQEMLNSKQISDLQRQGQLRQNSAQLKQAKQLQDREIAMQSRLTSANIEYDSNLSFLTRQQREDLAELGAYTKQLLFDQRLMFERSEGQRKFTNMQQLADFTVASAESQQQLQSRLQTMRQDAEREIIALQHAQDMITSRLTKEFERAEKQKDYALLKELARMKQAMEEKMRRKAARSAAISNIIVGGATIAGAVIGGSAGSIVPGAGTAGGAVLGAQAGQAAGQAVAGTAQSQGVY